MSAILDSMRKRPSAAGLREIARDQAALLRQVMVDNTTPAAAGQPTRAAVVRNATRRPAAGQMFIPADLSYATVDALLMQLAPCTYALRKADGSVTFFEVSEYRGVNRIQMLVGAPGSYQRYPMKLELQFMAVTHLLEDPTAAIKLFAAEANCCSRCHSPLTDAVSRATGLGPVCRTKI